MGGFLGMGCGAGIVNFAENRRHIRWRAQHPELPDFKNPAVRLARVIKRRETDGQVHVLPVLECQCDAYADILLTSPRYCEPPKGYQ
jgi:hypothetical protein